MFSVVVAVVFSFTCAKKEREDDEERERENGGKPKERVDLIFSKHVFCCFVCFFLQVGDSKVLARCLTVVCRSKSYIKKGGTGEGREICKIVLGFVVFLESISKSGRVKRKRKWLFLSSECGLDGGPERPVVLEVFEQAALEPVPGGVFCFFPNFGGEMRCES